MICAVFLRGVNTGGMILSMEDFCQILLDCGCERAATIQAAGTAVCRLDKEMTADFKADLEQRLTRQIGKPVHAIIRDADFIRLAVDQVEAAGGEGFHDYLILTEEEGLLDEIGRLHEGISFTAGERLVKGPGYMHWTIRKGDTLGEFGSKVLGARKFKDKLTSRNFNTIRKVLDVIRVMEGHSSAG